MAIESLENTTSGDYDDEFRGEKKRRKEERKPTHGLPSADVLVQRPRLCHMRSYQIGSSRTKTNKDDAAAAAQ